MHCISWHGTVLRQNLTDGRWIQALPWPVRGTAADWRVALPEGAGPPPRVLSGAVESASEPGLWIVPHARAGLAHLRRDGVFLCAHPHLGEVQFNRTAAGAWETFLLLDEQALKRLRLLLAWRWTDAGAGPATPALQTPTLEAAADGWPAVMEGGFRLRAGPHVLDLCLGVPEISQTGQFTDAASGRRFQAVARLPHTGEAPLRRRAADLQAPQVADARAFAATRNSRLQITGDLEFGLLPLAACRADQDWMQEKWRQPGPRRLAAQRPGCQVVREHDKFVLLNRGQEGMIFDEAGSSNETGYLLNVPVNAHAFLRREGDDVFVPREALDAAPHLAGPLVVFCNGNLSNYYHWLIEALLPLYALAPYVPAGAKLLLPETLQAFRIPSKDNDPDKTVDHVAALAEWGFGGWPTVTPAGNICRVDEVYWLDQCGIEHMPAAIVRAARAAVLRGLPPVQEPGRRIYVQRQGMRGVANEAAIEKLAREHGFAPLLMEGTSPGQQIALFRGAEFVMGPHGAGLANILYCEPDTKVIEFSPDCEFRPLFAQISDKVGLVHGVLPCPTDNGGFNGRMTVDEAKLRLLLRQMLAMQ